MFLQKIRLVAFFLLSGSFFIFDRILKHLAITNQDFTAYISKPWLGWEYFANPGIAFGIPLPWFTSLIYTPIILLGVLWYAIKKMIRSTSSVLGVILIVLGAISNLIDRVLFHITIDYLRILTSIINLADVMIVCGALLLFWQELKKKA